MAFMIGSLNRVGSVTVRPMPSGLEATAWSIREAVFSRSNLSGPRMVTFTSICLAASLIPCSTVHQNESQAHSACWIMVMFKAPLIVTPPVDGIAWVGWTASTVGAADGASVGWVTAVAIAVASVGWAGAVVG